MRKEVWAATALAVLAVGACKGKDAAMSDDLAKDVASASSDQGLSLAPSVGSQTVVSAVEQSPEARMHVAPSRRAPRAVPARHRTVRRAPVTPHVAPRVARAAAPAPTPAPAPDPAPAAVATTATTTTPSTNDGIVVTRPHPVDVSYPSGGAGDGSARGSGSGIGIGDVIGAIGSVVIRGGTVDGDHCDPRAERRHGGMGGISIGRQMPSVRLPMMRGGAF